MKTKKLIIGMLLLSLFLVSGVSAYTKSHINYGLFDQYVKQTGVDYDEACEAGQDFLVQIAPLGCEPTVVTSDLLEEQNVPVLCQLAATQINPLIDVKAIESISFSGDYSDMVSGVGFHPAQAALGTSGNINSAILENIGYVVIVLKETPAERDMPDYVDGKLTARIKYDIEDAFGIGKTTFYLSSMDESEWQENKNLYSFWNGNGLIRVNDIDGVDGKATIVVYDESASRLSTVSLEKGETSDEIYFPEFDCLTTLKVKLTDLVSPETKAQLTIDGQTIEVVEGEKFLDNKCTLRDVKKQGMTQIVKIYCSQDSDADYAGKNTFELKYIPQIKLNIDGNTKNHVVGDFLFTTTTTTTTNKIKYVYLAYVGTKEDSANAEDMHILLFESENDLETTLSEDNLKKLADLFEGRITSTLKKSNYNLKNKKLENKAPTKLPGNFYYLSPGESTKINDNSVKLIGLGNINDLVSTKQQNKTYNLIKTKNEDNNYTIQNTGLKLKFDSESIIIFDKDDKRSDGVKLSHQGEGSYILMEDIDISKITPKQKSFFSNIGKLLIGFDDRDKNLISTLTIYKEYDISGLLNRVKRTDKNQDNFASFTDNYAAAKEDYKTILNQFADTKEDSGKFTFGEKALRAKIELAAETQNINDLSESCDEFNSRYKDSSMYSIINSKYCSDEFFANSEISSNRVYTDGDSHLIAFQKLIEPTPETYGTKITIKNSEGKQETITLGKDGKYYPNPLNTQEYIQLKEVKKNTDLDKNKEDQIKLNINLKKENSNREYVHGTKVLEEKTPLSFGSEYTFTLREVYFEQQAKVVIEPSIKNTYTEANFSFNLSIEKRAIQLTPEETKKRIENLDEQIERWTDRQEKLAKVVKVMKGSCLAVEAWLTIQNFFTNVDGSATARNKVMRGTDGESGWYKKCANCISGGKNCDLNTIYASVDACLLAHNDEIEASVKSITEIMNSENEVLATAKKSGGCIKKTLFSETIDQKCLKKEYITKNEVEKLIKDLNDQGIQTVKVGNEDKKVNKTNFVEILKEKTVTEFRDLKVYVAAMASNAALKSDFSESIKENLADSYARYAEDARMSALEKQAKENGFGEIIIDSYKSKDSKTGIYRGYTTKASKVNFEENAIPFEGFNKNKNILYPYTIYTHEQKRVVSFLSRNSIRDYIIIDSYILKSFQNEKMIVSNLDEKIKESINRKFDKFTLVDANSYNNHYDNPELRYYTYPNEGVAAIVPFDREHGWYAAVTLTTLDSSTPASIASSSKTSAVDDSGAVRHFWLCNVGPDHEEDDRGDDDIFQRIDTTNPITYNAFSGLSSNEVQKLADKAINAIEAAQRAYKDGKKTVTIDGDTFNIGEDYASIPEVQCQDYMSPSNCNLLFNVCDPVICPSSRCDFGGAYPVKDVIQSGIIGSIMLCLPNFREGIYIPVCLSGINAGLQSYITILKNHRDCLQENLETGKMVGICDEIYSIYLCEFFWDQALPLTKIAVPKLLGWVYGESARAGGEYLGVESAWENAENSVNYFTDYYAVNSFQAFKARVTDDVGGSICKAYVSGVYPTEGILNDLTDPDSPPQFYGQFSSEIYTTATLPSVSQYKVFYHIYAGDDSQAAYKVYLKAAQGASIYEDSRTRVLATGYIPKGEYESETLDFTAYTGYTELCIRVNQYEECGFKSTSTSFAANYLSDLYAKEQAEETEITTESECVSGTASLYSLFNLNAQSAAEDLLDYDLSEIGITRICATNNPGTGTDQNRWTDVGYCGNKNIRCWIDKDSVQDVIDVLTLENDTMKTLSEKALEQLEEEEFIKNNYEFRTALSKIDKEGNSNADKITLITSYLKKAFFNKHKAQLYLLRGGAYGEEATKTYNKLIQGSIGTTFHQVDKEKNK